MQYQLPKTDYGFPLPRNEDGLPLDPKKELQKLQGPVVRLSDPEAIVGRYKIRVEIVRPHGHSFGGTFDGEVTSPSLKDDKFSLSTKDGRYFESDWRYLQLPTTGAEVEVTAAVPSQKLQLTVFDYPTEIPASKWGGVQPTSKTERLSRFKREHVFDFRYYPPTCSGSYKVILEVNVVGGQIAGSQMSRMQPNSGEWKPGGSNPKHKIPPTFERSGSKPRMRQKSENVFIYEWDPVNKPCGKYVVGIELDKEFPLTVSPKSTIEQVEINYGGTNPDPVEFFATLDLSAGGGGGMPSKLDRIKDESKQEAESTQSGNTSSLPLVGEYGETFEHLGQQGGVILGDQESTFEVEGAQSIEEPGISETPRCATRPPPWTLLDLRVDPENSADARDALNA